MSSRQLWPLALGAALAACGPPPPAPSRAAAEARGRCAYLAPAARADAPLEPRNWIDRVGSTEPDDPFARQGFFALARPPLSPREGAGYPLELRLTATPVLSSGQALDAALVLVNRARGPLTLARPVADGGSHLFEPYYDLYLRPEGSFRTFAYISLKDAPDCGSGPAPDGRPTSCGSDPAPDGRSPFALSPGLDGRPTFALAPGQAAPAPVHWAGPGGPKLLRPGRYVLWAVYRFCQTGGEPGAQTSGEPSTQTSGEPGAQTGGERGAQTGRERGTSPGAPAADPDVVRGEYASNPVSIEVR